MTDLYRSGHVKRWHQQGAISEQSNAAHQWGVWALLRELYPDASLELQFAALTHDVGELRSGDVSGPTKAAHPDLAEALDRVERQARIAILGRDYTLSQFEAAWLTLCDRLEALLWRAVKAPWTVGGAEWMEDRRDVWRIADELAVEVEVAAIIDGVAA